MKQHSFSYLFSFFFVSYVEVLLGSARFHESLVWEDNICAANRTSSSPVSRVMIEHPGLGNNSPIHTFQTRLQTSNSVFPMPAWYKFESVVENGTTTSGSICAADLSNRDHPFNLDNLQAWHLSSSNSTVTFWNVSLSRKSGRKDDCSNYLVDVGFYANFSSFEENIEEGFDLNETVHKSCDNVDTDGLYLIDPSGRGDSARAFWVRCRNGFTEITQQTARYFLNGTLSWNGDVQGSGYIDEVKPYTVDGAGDHYAHFDISVPFGFTQFYLEGFRIRATSYMGGASASLHKSDIRVSRVLRTDEFYDAWEPIDGSSHLLASPHGDFAFGAATERGPTTSYSRYQTVHSYADIHEFAGNGVMFSVSLSNKFRLLWGETGEEHEGWAWWSGSIWVRNVPQRAAVYKRCEFVPWDGVYLIDPLGQGTPFRTHCRDGFMKITQQMARWIFNATLSWSGDVKKSGFIDGKRPFTLDGQGDHYAHYDILIPFGYTEFFLENFNIRSAAYKEDPEATSEIAEGAFYTQWTQRGTSGFHGDFAFGSPDEKAPCTSFGRYQSISDSSDGIHRFHGNEIVFKVVYSRAFRLH
eukprot:gb/GECG01000851.1/.p1 GENE.gb/GECG01000851.1/~~gb/GECG01000851.1/.p1  ORF type:complete len:582 (+),score=37.02 gb/GECG01000851.1/:1-1746(+)